MNHSSNHIRFKRTTFIYFIVVLTVLVIATPVFADYLGPDRTVTEATSACKVILYECQYIASKDAWKYHKVGDWSCSNESKPWTAYSGNPSSQGCFAATAGDTYWSKEETLQEVTITYPPATINNSLQNCNLSNGWCNTTPELTLNGTEPLSGYDILAIEGSLNGQTFACPGGNCSIPLSEGNNDFTFWALSSWGDSSEMETFSSRVDTVPPTLGLDITAANGKNGWYVSQASVSAIGSDSTSGLSNVFLSVNNGTWEPSAMLNEGVHKVDVRAEDNAGNTSDTSSVISIDTTSPSIDLSLNGLTGKNGWHISNLEIVASATDATSGVDSFNFSIDGGVYTDYNSPITFSDGLHTIKFKTTDHAGNETQTPMQEFHIDTVAPTVDIPAFWEVNETITYSVQDEGSGLASLRVVIEDEDERYAKIAWNENVSGTKFKDTITWDGTFKDGTVAPAGEYLVWIKASDMAGNESYTLGMVTVPSPFSLFQFVPERISPTITPKPPKELFEEGTSPAETSSYSTSSFGGSTAYTGEKESMTFSVSSSAHSTNAATNSNILWGAAAASVISAAALYAREEKRKREEEAAKKRKEIEARIAAQNAQKKAAEEARKIAQWYDGQVILRAEIEERKSKSGNKRIGSKELLLDADTKSYTAKPEEWKVGFHAYMSRKAMEEYRAGEKAEYVVKPKEKPWWVTAWDNMWALADQHQTELSLGTGVVVGAAAVLGVATSIIAAPALLVIGAAALITAALVTSGTMAINYHYGRDFNQNLGSNLTTGIISTLVVAGAGLLLVNAAPWITTTIASTCTKYTNVCTQIGPIIDHGEELLLTTQLAYYNLTGDQNNAASTIIEIQLEKMDGGIPGNSLALEIGDQLSKFGPDAVELIAKHGDDIVPLLVKYGDDAIDIIGAYGDEGIELFLRYGNQADELITLIRNYGDDAVQLLSLNTVDVVSAQKLLTTLDDDVVDYAIQQGPDAVDALSRWSAKDLLEFGPELALRAQKDADVLRDINKLMDLGPIDPAHLTREQQNLIKEIAANSTQYTDEGQIVLGKWVDYGNGFTEVARETGSAHYNPHPDMWNLLEKLGDGNREEAAWLVNKQVIQTGIDKGLPFEYTLDGVPSRDVLNEQNAIQLIFSGKTDEEIKRALRLDYIPVRMKELQELQKADYMFVFDEISNSFIISLP